MTIDEAIEEIEFFMQSDSYVDAPSNEACALALKALCAQREAERENGKKGGTKQL